MKPQPRAGDRLPEIRRNGRRVVRTVSPATGEILEWHSTRRAWGPPSPPPWFEGPAFRYCDFAGGGRLNVHNPTGCAVAPGSRVWYAGRLRAVARFYDSGSPCYAGAWSGSVRINGRTVRGRVYVSPDFGNEITTLRFAPEGDQ